MDILPWVICGHLVIALFVISLLGRREADKVRAGRREIQNLRNDMAEKERRYQA